MSLSGSSVSRRPPCYTTASPPPALLGAETALPRKDVQKGSGVTETRAEREKTKSSVGGERGFPPPDGPPELGCRQGGGQPSWFRPQAESGVTPLELPWQWPRLAAGMQTCVCWRSLGDAAANPFFRSVCQPWGGESEHQLSWERSLGGVSPKKTL